MKHTVNLQNIARICTTVNTMSAHTFCKTIHAVNTKHTCMHYCRNHTGHKTNAVDNVIYFFPYAQGNKPTKKKIPSFHEHNMNKKRTPHPPQKKKKTQHINCYCWSLLLAGYGQRISSTSQAISSFARQRGKNRRACLIHPCMAVASTWSQASSVA